MLESILDNLDKRYDLSPLETFLKEKKIWSSGKYISLYEYQKRTKMEYKEIVEEMFSECVPENLYEYKDYVLLKKRISIYKAQIAKAEKNLSLALQALDDLI